MDISAICSGAVADALGLEIPESAEEIAKIDQQLMHKMALMLVFANNDLQQEKAEVVNSGDEEQIYDAALEYAEGLSKYSLEDLQGFLNQ